MTDSNNLSDVHIVIAQELDLILPEDQEADRMNPLVQRINYLILHDFDRLVSILYRLDVDESKLKAILKTTQLNTSADADAGLLISKLLIERQLEKLKTRNQYRNQEKNVDDNERW